DDGRTVRERDDAKPNSRCFRGVVGVHAANPAARQTAEHRGCADALRSSAKEVPAAEGIRRETLAVQFTISRELIVWLFHNSKCGHLQSWCQPALWHPFRSLNLFGQRDERISILRRFACPGGCC